MSTLDFSRHNTLIATDDESFDIPDANYRAHYKVWSSQGRMVAEIQRIERNDNGVWRTDRLSALEINAIEASIERAAEREKDEDRRDRREAALGY